MTTAIVLGVAVSIVTMLGLFSTRRRDGQLATLSLVAAALKLEFVPRLRRARGRVRTSPEGEGIQVRVSVGTGDTDRFRIECMLAPSLHMGLELAPASRFWSSWYWDPRFRDPDLREAFVIRALFEEQVDLLFNGWILRELLRLQNSGYVPTLNDYSLRLLVGGGYDPQHIKLVIERAARLAEGIVQQRLKLPPSALERDVERTFAPVAGRLRGHFDRANLTLELRDESGELDVWVEHASGAKWVTRFELCLERRLAPKLRIADSRHAALLTRWREPDIRVGDAAFDAAFLVRAEREEAARTALTPEVRRALLELRELIEQVEIEDGRITGCIEHVLMEASALEAKTLALLTVGGAFAQTRRARSAYR